MVTVDNTAISKFNIDGVDLTCECNVISLDGNNTGGSINISNSTLNAASSNTYGIRTNSIGSTTVNLSDTTINSGRSGVYHNAPVSNFITNNYTYNGAGSAEETLSGGPT
jgi:hypothetical protein